MWHQKDFYFHDNETVSCLISNKFCLSARYDCQRWFFVYLQYLHLDLPFITDVCLFLKMNYSKKSLCAFLKH